jgi:hypothetical protein
VTDRAEHPGPEHLRSGRRACLDDPRIGKDGPMFDSLLVANRGRSPGE